MQQRFAKAKERFGLDRQLPPLRTDLFVPPADRGQPAEPVLRRGPCRETMAAAGDPSGGGGGGLCRSRRHCRR